MLTVEQIFMSLSTFLNKGLTAKDLSSLKALDQGSTIESFLLFRGKLRRQRTRVRGSNKTNK